MLGVFDQGRNGLERCRIIDAEFLNTDGGVVTSKRLQV